MPSEKITTTLPYGGRPALGSGTLATSDGTSRYTQTPDGDNCRIDVTWSGALIDTQPVHDKVAEEAQKNGKKESDLDLTIETVTLTADSVQLVDESGANVTPPSVPAWKADLTLAGQPLLDLSGMEVSQLLTKPTTVTLNAAELATVNAAYKARGKVAAAGTASLSIANQDLPSLSQRMLKVLFKVTADINGNVKVSL